MNFDIKKIQEWVKNNMVLTISAVVSLILIIAAVIYLLQGINASAAAKEELASAKSQLNSMQTAEPYPNKANIEILKEQNEELKKLQDEFGKKFAPVPIPPETYTASGFKYKLEEMVSSLTKKAKEYSIQLPTNRVNFSFGFTAQRSNLRMDTNSLKIQAEQLAHVDYLCTTLLDSGISEFIRVRRAAGATNDLLQVANYIADYLPARKIITNQYSFVYPYEIVFKTSPGDLAKYINTLEQSPYGLTIKCVKVERAESMMTDELADYQETVNPMMMRGGMRGMRGGAGGMRMIDPRLLQQQQQEAKNAEQEEAEKALPKVTTTVLKPTAIRVTMYVDFMRMKTEEEMTSAAAAPQSGIDLDGDGTLDVADDGVTPLPGASCDPNGVPIEKGADASAN
ncbi:MAG: Amuc_1100 family pilus-like protein [Verrucomicrobia bacterium]|nr:Amuc_1100 family pilus-like protein [Verrucomicrobiota bacterium]MBR5978171.1 Amuc_1100 family pilus-like protein [Verrucomicrobiota bacterium]